MRATAIPAAMACMYMAVAPPAAHAQGSREASAEAGLSHLRRVQDEFHSASLGVYADVSDAGNHFEALSSFAGGGGAATVSGSATVQPRSGATCVRCTFTGTGADFGGFVFQVGLLAGSASAPSPSDPGVADAGLDLRGATELRFWARGASGGEVVDFFMGGAGRSPSGQPTAPFPDSTAAVHLAPKAQLSTQWRQYTIPLAGVDLRYVLTGFGWGASALDNPGGGIVFFVDDVEFILDAPTTAARLAQPCFLRSFATQDFQGQAAPVGDFDLRFRNTAFTYDNALALLAFLASGSAGDLARARRIGDAFVHAAGHDRAYDDGRLRDAYCAGDLALPPGWTPNGRTATARIPGYFDESTGTFFEVEQGGISTGNNAWAMIALLALHQRLGLATSPYLTEARALGAFIVRSRQTTGAYQGFRAGLDAPESASPVDRTYASSEHNLDIYAAFTTMNRLTGEIGWAIDAAHALAFARAMLDPGTGCLATGTIDPSAINTAVLPLDPQTFGVLALRDATLSPGLLACAEAHQGVIAAGLVGFDFDGDRDGIWFEGTAQAAAAYAVAGGATLSAAADARCEDLRIAQATPPFGDGAGLAAASKDGLTTGFGLFYFTRLHIAATAWNVFAQRRFNPFYDSAPPAGAGGGAGGGGGGGGGCRVSTEPGVTGIASWLTSLAALLAVRFAGRRRAGGSTVSAGARRAPAAPGTPVARGSGPTRDRP